MLLLQALAAIPCSSEIWINLISLRKEAGASPEVVRHLLEVAARKAGKAWDSSNLWKFYALCELEYGDVSGALSVLLRALKMPIGGQAELLKELRKYLAMYQPGSEGLVMEEAKPSEELLDRITCRKKFEEELTRSGGPVTKAETVTWKNYLDYMREQSIEGSEDIESTERISQVQALYVDQPWLH